jgi:hypothetical protein
MDLSLPEQAFWQTENNGNAVAKKDFGNGAAKTRS